MNGRIRVKFPQPLAPSRKGSVRQGRSRHNVSGGRYAAVDAPRVRRQGKLDSARADKTMENVAVMLNASSVHTKRKAWPEAPMSPPRTPRDPFM